MKSLGLVVLTGAFLVFSSLGGAGGAGTVSGQVLDTKGKPITNAKIWVKPVVTTGLFETRSDANGKYLATGLPPVGYRVMGWFEREYNGKRYCLRLGHLNAADYSPVNPANGAKRDLLWRIQGRIEDVEIYSDLGFFGGSVSVFNESSLPIRTQNLELTFTPTQSLIDGSSGKTLIRKPNAEGYLLDIPVGQYKVSAVRLENGSKTPVPIGVSATELAEQTILEFQPEKNTCTGNSASGVARAYLYVKLF
jgi:hypothetical protein